MLTTYAPDLSRLADWCDAILDQRYPWLDADLSRRIIEYYKREIDFAWYISNPRRSRLGDRLNDLLRDG